MNDLIPSLPFVEHDNLSIAWGLALERCLRHRRESAPMIVSITGFDDGAPREVPAIRHALDRLVTSRGGWSIDTVANTIFPINQWNPGLPRSVLFARYERTYRKLRRMPSTRDGTYFGRMVARDLEPKNQLELVLSSYKEGRSKRRSKLQVAVFDPARDHSNAPYQSFPCMQHVAFSPEAGGKLSVTAFYTLQYMVQRAYGNYLGLCRLGHFVAHELNRKLTRVTCVAGIAEVERRVEKEKPAVRIADLAPLRKLVASAVTR